MIPEDTTYRVKSWDTKETFATYNTLNEAKRDCRSRGYIHTFLGGNMAIAYVECDVMHYDLVWSEEKNEHIKVEKRLTDCCIYAPRYK